MCCSMCVSTACRHTNLQNDELHTVMNGEMNYTDLDGENGEREEEKELKREDERCSVFL